MPFQRRPARWLLTLAATLLASTALAAPALSESHSVGLRLLAINDLHGGIDSGRTLGGRAVGGAAVLAAYLQQYSAQQDNVLVVGAGDLVGASPPISTLLRHEPTVQVLNAMHLQIDTPGNHDFDRGVGEFFRLHNGGCDTGGHCFDGAAYRETSANILDASTGEPLLSPYAVKTFGGISVAFIGAVLPEVPSLTVAGSVTGLVFADPAASINGYVHQLQQQGVHAFVVLIHQGGSVDRSNRLTGPITPVLDALDPDVDVVLSGHTHRVYALRYGGKLVTQGFSYGTAFVSVDLSLDPLTRDVVQADGKVVTTFEDGVTPVPLVQSIVNDASRQLGPQLTTVIAQASAPLTRARSRAGESALGDLIADGQRWQSSTQIAVTNPGGIRSDLSPGDLLWSQAFAVQPFQNDLISLTLTGDQLFGLFNQQWSLGTNGQKRYLPLQVSGLKVTWDGSRSLGDRVVALSLDSGDPIDRSAPYQVVANSFLAGGGDGFTILTQGTDRQVGPQDWEAWIAYLAHLPQPISPPPVDRLSRLD